jgi:hypothetical protein
MPFLDASIPKGALSPDSGRRPDSARAPALVREIALPPDALALSTLAHVDYTDAFLLETDEVGERTGEEWGRAILEDAPAKTRTMLRRGWFALGLRLGATDDERLILGWRLLRSAPDHALLAARSLIGIEAEVLVKREGEGLLAATLIKFGNPITRGFWTGFSFQHRRVLRHLLEQAGRRALPESRGLT